MLDLRPAEGGFIVPISAHPGARRTAIDGVQSGMLKIYVTESPERGKANKAIVALLAKSLKIPKSHVTLLRGATHGHKLFLIQGVDGPTLQALASSTKENRAK